MNEGEQFGSGFLGANPNSTIPVLMGHSTPQEKADIAAVVAVDLARVVKLRRSQAHPHLLRWRQAMALRPAMSR